ncbi:Peroxiredoxin [Variovorax sp. CF079]|uniref:peroxiredoxin-like family protein n=1 Tax=Variovorax sp. CF079 TaxID=1882774 RepID=UPI00087E896A|nr:peroxiredoxin-like family protein [Variovorax sp. CF079]SDD52013.1 Peroxiredoxin [Variovorax sp. CF079]
MTPTTSISDAAGILRAMGVCERAKREGDMAPDVSLRSASGAPVKLSDLWHGGPLVVIFYRGGWCSYCNLQLHAWQQHASELKRLGAALVAISPQTPDHSLDTIERNALAYTVLSDSSLDAANGFGIAITLPPELIDLYASAGTDIPVLNGNAQWVLPIPATYVIDQTGRIRFAHVEMDYRERVDPQSVIAIIEGARY